MLRSIMEAQDQLERKYISKKEEHRALEMQKYIGLSRNTGTFDPNRLKRLHYCTCVWMCIMLMYPLMYVCVCVFKYVQAGGGRHIQDRDASWGHKGDDRQKCVWADFSTSLILYSHIHEGDAACEAQSSLHAHTLTSTIPAWGNNWCTHIRIWSYQYIAILILYEVNNISKHDHFNNV